VENFTLEVSATVAYLNIHVATVAYPNLHAATVSYPATIDYQIYLSDTTPRPQSQKKRERDNNRTTYSEC
jgi:hypothetical protein